MGEKISSHVQNQKNPEQGNADSAQEGNSRVDIGRVSLQFVHVGKASVDSAADKNGGDAESRVGDGHTDSDGDRSAEGKARQIVQKAEEDYQGDRWAGDNSRDEG